MRSGLKCIFHWKARWSILFKSSFKFCADNSSLGISEKSDVSAANNLGFETKFSGKWFVHIRKSSGPKSESGRTPASTFFHVECLPLRITFLFSLWENQWKYVVNHLLPHFALVYK